MPILQVSQLHPDLPFLLLKILGLLALLSLTVLELQYLLQQLMMLQIRLFMTPHRLLCTLWRREYQQTVSTLTCRLPRKTMHRH